MKNEKGKLILFGVFLTFIFAIVAFCVTTSEYYFYKQSVNRYLYRMVRVLMEKYPTITDQEIMKILNSDEREEYLEDFRKYGIDENTSLIVSLEKNYKISSALNITLMVSFACLSLFCFFWYFARKEKHIREITNYMREINHKNYLLLIDDNSEGELSVLRNEVYKTTIMLREESENLKKEKLALKDSISDISHQLKTPLTSILIMLDNILDHPTMDNETKMDFISNVHHQVENINFLIVSLLKLSRIDAGVVVFKKEDIFFKKLLETVLKNVEVLREVKNVEIFLEVEESMTFVGDFHWELEAITNLVKNAIEYSQESGKIEIKVVENPLYSKLSIQDYGNGMTEKDLKNLFNRFYKGENSSSDSIGIGLSLSKKIIETDGGYIRVDSLLGKGTLFEIKYMK